MRSLMRTPLVIDLRNVYRSREMRTRWLRLPEPRPPEAELRSLRIL